MAKEKASKGRPASSSGRNPAPIIAGAVALLLIAVGVLVSCGPAAGVNGGSATNGPSLAVDPEKIDFGQVKVDNIVKADFRLRNIGNQPLQIIGEPAVRVVEGC
jgi:hypothetical protein